jgi:hypothetical protein
MMMARLDAVVADAEFDLALSVAASPLMSAQQS